ncbi:MAG: gfo/Idh/MocA family oxidoreductase [Phycisphaerales bacterium]|nr:MAG: gfo/Idh/MocA family oxidoreductase [Phycisphaerales bacterium]
MKLGAIGIDSSHLPEFSRRIKELHDKGETPCLVTSFYDPGDHDWPNPDDVAKWRSTTLELGAKQVASMDELLGSVDGVLVLAVNGNKHAELATPALEKGLPAFIDKPLTCDFQQAKRLLESSRKGGARVFSSSSLRFAAELEQIDRGSLGDLVAIDASGPGELNPSMPGLFHYGCHTVEMIDQIWGPGAGRVSAIETPDRHLVDIEYRDGRYARLRLERKGAWDFNATLHGTKGVHQFRVDFGPVYSRFVGTMAKFFEGGEPPASLRDIVETIGVLEAGNASAAKDGAWVEVPEVA